ncbi:DUF3826 domain-containing protein [Hufsiella ginkgonis]|uniref:DUF3826 domain-containing protein n=1 Tax=Hufsiella ginkgonis TaxID=2695274 RepID=A0A7K1XW40_9SPHI|nr:DUF3826 domain-containing protein [Hufsiella ginkgonis]MXV15194.1 DUF3826 domain-containing protein [Hufsiella ginkgonis]
MRSVLKFSFPGIFALLFSVGAIAQTAEKAVRDQEYIKTITLRSDKIAAVLGIADSAKYKRVRTLLVNEYSALNDVHETRNQETKALKEELKDDKAKLDSGIAGLEAVANRKLDALHNHFLASLAKELNQDQIEQVKNGLTYNVLPITWKAYQEMLPDLTEPQKKQMLAWLTEAREHAMDAESSDKKHAWFGKYKGRINNYLSAQGIDMKKAGEDWQKRIKAAQQKN